MFIMGVVYHFASLKNIEKRLMILFKWQNIQFLRSVANCTERHLNAFEFSDSSRGEASEI